MKNKGVEFKIIIRKDIAGMETGDPLEVQRPPMLVIKWKYKGEEWGTLLALSKGPDEYTAKVIEEALNNIGDRFTYRSERNVLDKVISKIHRLGMVFRHKLQSSVPAPSSDGKLETEEVERD